MPQFPAPLEDSIGQLLKVRVALLGIRANLADVVDKSLDSILVAFFLSLHHDDYADDHVGGCQVEEHWL